MNGDTYLVPIRHVCGNILHANLEGDSPIFYNRFTGSGIYLRFTGGAPLLSCPRCPYPLNMDWVKPLYLVDPMPSNLAVLTIGRRVCSNCWGGLGIGGYTSEGDALVLCHRCRWETIGYVTMKYVGHAREKDYLDYGLCIMGLAEALELEQEGLPFDLSVVKQPKSKEVNLMELGF